MNNANPEGECCKKCFFFQFTNEDEEFKEWGICRKFPPMTFYTGCSYGNGWRQPDVKESGWCGEFREKE
jgi:hypothetical protein